MSESVNSSNDPIDSLVLDEFISDYRFAHSVIENLLISLESSPADSNLLNKLFREVHSIKGNSHFLGFREMTDFLHALETVLDKLRSGELFFNSAIGDIVLKAIDQIADFIDDAKSNQRTNSEQAKLLRNDLINLVHMANLAKPN